MDKLESIIGSLSGVHTEEIHTEQSFMDIASRFANTPGTVLLMSGGSTDSSRYHILGINPWLICKGRGRQMIITSGMESILLEKDSLDTLTVILDRLNLEGKTAGLVNGLPLQAGLMGYLSYDVKDGIEDLPRTSVDDLRLPHICFFAHSLILIHDKKHNLTTICIPLRTDKSNDYPKKEIKRFYRILSEKPPKDEGFSGNREGFTSFFTKTDYMKSVEKIREYITSGDVYQVNMSQRFEMGFGGSGFSLFKSLFQQNPAPFFSYIHAGDHQIVSTSPERFILQKGKSVETRPIKGTRPRGKTPEEDEKLKYELKKSKKDDAELSMIVDLLRNDIGKVCKGSSVYVDDHKRLEAYDNVFHLVSIVKGELDKNKNSVDLIRAVFPGGSITGCPKIRSMEIIDELEPVCRHIYTGSIGYISFHNTMDLSIAIRTATIYNEKIFFSAGGGVVFDSDPEEEFEETLHKGKSLMDIFGGHGNKDDNMGNKEDQPRVKPVVWINGVVKKQQDASLSVTDQGVLYGYGFFETIRVEKGVPAFLDSHITRFNKSWQELFFREAPDLTWKDIVDQVVKANRLTNKTAAVRIMATYGDREVPPYNNSLVVTAKPYVHRLSEKGEKGLCLATYPEPRETPLANHKTMNYLYYLLAGKWAKKNGAGEALIMNPDGTISETNTANILLFRDKSVVLPQSPAVLPGVMQKEVVRLLTDWDFTVYHKKVTPDDLFSYRMIITNSLMGAVPVLSVDGKKFPAPDDLWKKINKQLLGMATS
jgi:para-aminobenzoate synthetase component I